MKRSNLFPVVGLSISVFISACEKQASTPETPGTDAKPAVTAPAESKAAVALDAKKLLEAFASAGPEEQSRAGKAAQALQVEAYPAALGTLEKLIAEGHLTAEQKELVTGFIAQLKQTTAKKQ